MRWLAAVQEQHRVYFDSATQDIKPQFAEFTACPACASKKSRLLFEKDWFRYHECGECSLVFMNPRLNSAATQQFYNSTVNAIYNETKFHDPSLTKGDDERNLFNLDLIARHGAAKGKLLEVGCAKGFFLKKAKERGFEPYGVELNRQLYQLARASIGDTVYDVDLLEAKLPAAMFDVLYMRDLIEHIPNPKPFFDELNRVARPGAIIVLETHNVRGLIHRIVGRKHTVIFGFEHPVHWSPTSLRAALKSSGFDIDEIVFTSPDFTVGDILAYAGPATFTTILPPRISALRAQLVRLIGFGLRLPGIRSLDTAITSRIANRTGLGSVMKVVARKTAVPSQGNSGRAR